MTVVKAAKSQFDVAFSYFKSPIKMMMVKSVRLKVGYTS